MWKYWIPIQKDADVSRCRKSIELHDKRHREIAQLTRRLLLLDKATEEDARPLQSKKRKIRKRAGFKSLKPDNDHSKQGDEEVDWADTSTLFEDDMDFQGLAMANKREALSAAKLVKGQGKFVKHQNNFGIITAGELDRIQEALHPIQTTSGNKGDDVEGIIRLMNNLTIATNIAFNPNTCKYASLRSTIRSKKIARQYKLHAHNSCTTLDSSHLQAILRKLGILASSSGKSKERQNTFTRLRHAIEKDLNDVENENRETMARMVGYWRYVNRRTYNVMVRNNQLWDWQTGTKLEEIEEDSESEAGISSELDNYGREEGATRFSEFDTDVGTPPLLMIEDYNDDFMVDPNASLRLINSPDQYCKRRVADWETRLDNTPVFGAVQKPFSQSINYEEPHYTPSTTRGLALPKKEYASPWVGVKDTRHLPRDHSSPSSPPRRYRPFFRSALNLRLLPTNTNAKANTIAPNRPPNYLIDFPPLHPITFFPFAKPSPTVTITENTASIPTTPSDFFSYRSTLATAPPHPCARARALITTRPTSVQEGLDPNNRFALLSGLLCEEPGIAKAGLRRGMKGL